MPAATIGLTQKLPVDEYHQEQKNSRKCKRSNSYIAREMGWPSQITLSLVKQEVLGVVAPPLIEIQANPLLLYGKRDSRYRLNHLV